MRRLLAAGRRMGGGSLVIGALEHADARLREVEARMIARERSDKEELFKILGDLEFQLKFARREAGKEIG